MSKQRIRNPLTATLIPRRRIEHHLLTGSGDEMRRLLWTIMGSAQLLLRSRDLGPRNHRLAERIDASAQHLAHVVRDLLDEALAHTGLAMPLNPRATDMRVIADEAVTEAKINNPGRWIKHTSEGSGVGEWDHDRVLQLVSNLLAHALERSEETSPVSFAWSGNVHSVLVEVEYSPDPSCGDRDLGLGLSVARHIALAHGGDIRVTETSAGALIMVDLPRRKPARRVKSSPPDLRIVNERRGS